MRLTFDRLLSQIVIRHSLDTVRSNCLFEDGGSVLQDDAALESWILLLERHALLAITAAYIDEDRGLGGGGSGVLSVEREDIEPRGERDELRFHEPVVRGALNGVRLEPGVEVDRAVMTDLKGRPLVCWVREGVVQGIEGWEAVVVAKTGG
jgi:hypothetical protein